MTEKIKVVLYGGSIFIACLEAGLSAVPDLEVVCIEEQAEGSLEQIRLAEPEAIVFELSAKPGNQTEKLIGRFPEVTLIGLDPESDRHLVLSIQRNTALATADLVKVIWDHYPSRKE